MADEKPDQQPINPREAKRKRAVRTAYIFGAIFLVGLTLRMVAGGRNEVLMIIGNWIGVIGFLGLAWWASVLFDLAGGARR